MNEQEIAMLEFENAWWQMRGSKETAIREQFGISAVRYAQKLNNLLDEREALEQFPLLVNRLRRIREQRVTEREQRKTT